MARGGWPEGHGVDDGNTNRTENGGANSTRAPGHTTGIGSVSELEVTAGLRAEKRGSSEKAGVSSDQHWEVPCKANVQGNSAGLGPVCTSYGLGNTLAHEPNAPPIRVGGNTRNGAVPLQWFFFTDYSRHIRAGRREFQGAVGTVYMDTNMSGEEEDRGRAGFATAPGSKGKDPKDFHLELSSCDGRRFDRTVMLVMRAEDDTLSVLRMGGGEYPCSSGGRSVTESSRVIWAPLGVATVHVGPLLESKDPERSRLHALFTERPVADRQHGSESHGNNTARLVTGGGSKSVDSNGGLAVVTMGSTTVGMLNRCSSAFNRSNSFTASNGKQSVTVGNKSMLVSEGGGATAGAGLAAASPRFPGEADPSIAADRRDRRCFNAVSLPPMLFLAGARPGASVLDGFVGDPDVGGFPAALARRRAGGVEPVDCAGLDTATTARGRALATG